MLVQMALAAVCLIAPVEGPVTAGFAPIGDYAGHWGIDFGVTVGTPIRAPASGRVTFAGSVAGMLSVTIEPVSGYKVSVSYLSELAVLAGQSVSRGQTIGRSGSPHGSPGAHLSARIDGRYVDPRARLGCISTDISRALRLLPPPAPYPRRRAHRHPGWDLRPDPYRTPSRRRDCPVSGKSRPGAVHAGGGALAEA
jgi:murein DD-endopeptidase MepM/ murein hydrolase activator NlpD